MANFSDLRSTANLYVEIYKLRNLYRRHINMHCIDVVYERLINDTESTMKELVSFLGIKWQSDILNYHNKRFRRNVDTPSHEGVTKPIYRSSIGRWKHFEKHLSPMLDILEHCTSEYNDYISNSTSPASHNFFKE